MRVRDIARCTAAILVFNMTLFANDANQTKNIQCEGDAKWLNKNHKVSKEINKNNQCNFDKFAWEWFIESVKEDKCSNAQFENWIKSDKIFVDNGQKPSKWKKNSQDNDILKVAKTIDNNQKNIYYEILVNKPVYDFVVKCDLYKSNCVSNLKGSDLVYPSNSVELKNGWVILNKNIPQGIYFEKIATVLNPDTKMNETHRLGLETIDIVVSSTKGNTPIWATFQHKNNLFNDKNKNSINTSMEKLIKKSNKFNSIWANYKMIKNGIFNSPLIEKMNSDTNVLNIFEELNTNGGCKDKKFPKTCIDTYMK